MMSSFQSCLQTKGLPVLVSTDCDKDKQELAKEVTDALKQGYKSFYGIPPSVEESNAWRSFVKNVLDELYGTGYPLIFEYPLLGTSRVDLIVVGSGKALVVEGKGWHKLEVVDEMRAIADGENVINPCYQLNGYVSKFKHLHSAGNKLIFSGVVYAYNATSWKGGLNCKVLRKGELKGEVKRLPLDKGVEQYLKDIVEGTIKPSKSLVEVLRTALDKGDDIKVVAQNTLKNLLGQGYSLTDPQARLVLEVLEDLESTERVAYLIEGRSGSGKTLVALTLFLLALSKGYTVMLGYVNNRLVNVLRGLIESAVPSEVGKAISSLIGYSALPRKDGMCDVYSRFDGDVDLLIIDEAQRLPEHSVKSCFKRSAKVIVALYDDDQTLLANEAGTGNNLLSWAKASGRFVKRYVLPGCIRVPEEYVSTIKKLLWSPKELTAVDLPIKVVVFEDVKTMLCELVKRYSEGHKVALLCAFTESRGDPHKKLCWDSLDNIRIGYPLKSGFNLYKSSNLKVKWLMDERREYPLYWQQRFGELMRLYAKYNKGFGFMDPVCICSSVYGAQGMEADYVGVVWGRDLVWRGSWVLNPGPITDYVGGKYSLKNVATKNPIKALDMLKNRYYIMLTRATKGVYLFFEDEETGKFVASAFGVKMRKGEGCELKCPNPHGCSVSPRGLRSRSRRMK